MQLTPATILLGEPAWVDVTVVNRSAGPLLVDMGNSCFGAKELIVQLPQAEPQIHDRLHCGSGVAGSCLVEFAVPIGAGGTFRRRYVLSGDFRITHAGNYTVLLQKNFSYGPDHGELTPGAPPHFPHLTEHQIVQTQLTLNVLPPNHKKLLQIEEAEAAQLEAPLPNLPFPPNAGIDLVRQISDENRKLQQDASAAKYVLANGLVEAPTYGMEPIFSTWLAQNNTSAADWALRALSRLNTPASRKILAHQAASSDKPQENTIFQIHRWEAIDALGNMGDASYVPLLEKLTRDPYHDVQRTAVRALGLLGGEKELPFLNTIALSAQTMTDRQDAVMAMGDTGSLRAVPFLIKLYTLPGSDESTSEYALWTLTHHHVQPPYTRMLTPQEGQRAWQDWWTQNQHTARVYGPYDCGDLKEPSTTLWVTRGEI